MCTTLLCWKRGLTCAALIGSAARTWSSTAFFQRDLFQNMQLSSDTLLPSTADLLRSRSRWDAGGSMYNGSLASVPKHRMALRLLSVSALVS